MAIRERNWHDCDLYETAKALFEQSRSQELTLEFDIEVEAFVRQNKKDMQ